MKISGADLARNRALNQIGLVLRDLTANLMRVVRGAGKPQEIVEQVAGLVDALSAHQDAVGYFPRPEELASMLSIEGHPDLMDEMYDEHLDQAWAQEAILRGALEIVASRLLGQALQEKAGHRELSSGIGDRGRIRAERRKRREATRQSPRQLTIAKSRSPRSSGGAGA